MQSEQITSDEIRQQLQLVIDPELHIDIVSLGLLYNVTITDKEIVVLLTLTTPGCPLAPVIVEKATEAIAELNNLQNRKINIEITFDPPWVPDMMSEEARAELGF